MAKQWAAQNAAPYLHRRMPIALEGGDGNKPLMMATIEQLRQLSDDELEVLMRISAKFTGMVIEGEVLRG